METLSLATIKRGAAIEMVDDAIQRLLENVVDPNTDAESKRKVTLAITLTPDKNREMLHIDLSVKMAMAPQATVSSIAYVSHTRDGVVAVENDPRQPGLFEEPAEGAAEVVDIKKGGSK